MSAGLTLESAAGVLSLLKEDDTRLKVIALKKIDKHIDYYWHEIAEHVNEMYLLPLSQPLLNLQTVMLSTKTRASVNASSQL